MTREEIRLDASLDIETAPDGVYFHFKGFSLYWACMVLCLAGFKRAMDLCKEQ